MVKKIISILILVAACSTLLLFTGCSNNFEKVHSVTYTMDGKTYTVTSTYGISISGSGEDCSESEFNSSKHKFNSSDMPKFVGYELNKNSETIDSFGTLNDSDKGDCFVIKNTYNNPPVTQTNYKKYTFEGFSYSYVYVKIVDDDTIVIKQNGNETTYNVSSYSITRFSK